MNPRLTDLSFKIAGNLLSRPVMEQTCIFDIGASKTFTAFSYFLTHHLSSSFHSIIDGFLVEKSALLICTKTKASQVLFLCAMVMVEDFKTVVYFRSL